MLHGLHFKNVSAGILYSKFMTHIVNHKRMSSDLLKQNMFRDWKEQTHYQGLRKSIGFSIDNLGCLTIDKLFTMGGELSS